MPVGAGRRRKPDPGAGHLHRAVALPHARARWPLQDLRGHRRRLRPSGGLRHGGAQAPCRRARRRRPCAGGDPGQCRQSGWPEQRPHRAERPGAGGRDPRSAGRCASGTAPGGLHRSPRHGHATRRSARGARDRRRIRPRPCRRAAARDRLGQDQRRPPRRRGWGHGPDQIGARAAAAHDSAAPPFRGAQPAHPLG